MCQCGAWFQHLKICYDGPLSNLAFNFNLRPYTESQKPCDEDESDCVAQEFLKPYIKPYAAGVATYDKVGELLSTITRPTDDERGRETLPRACIRRHQAFALAPVLDRR